ncbi:MAG: hypothetical protein AAF211_30385, partial [Myxococcota bacterium]
DASEFDAFGDLVDSLEWRIVTPSGARVPMDGAPIFTRGEASWNHPEIEGRDRSVEADECRRRLLAAR